VSVPVRIFCAQGEVPLMVNGAISSHSDAGVQLHCESGASKLQHGAKVVLTITGSEEKRTGTITGLVEAADGTFVVDFTDHERHSADKRDFPRLHAGLPISYMPATTESAQAWVDGESVDGEWTTPDPYMNFSVSGLRFDAAHNLKQGDLLNITLQIGGADESWRVTGRVVRVFEVPVDSPAACSVAVSFEHLPTDALDALSDLTLQIQDSLL